jgi:hypothetical protein
VQKTVKNDKIPVFRLNWLIGEPGRLKKQVDDSWNRPPDKDRLSQSWGTFDSF